MPVGTIALIAQIISLIAQGAAAIPALELAFETLKKSLVEGREPTADELAALQNKMNDVHAMIQGD